MPKTFDFKKRDLPIGQLGEDLVIHLLAALDWTLVERPKGNHPGWDAKVKSTEDGAEFTVEVKWDRMQAKTKNVAFETKQSRNGNNYGGDAKPSGVAATKADLLIYLVNLDGTNQAVHLVDPRKLLTMLNDAEPDFKWDVLGWDRPKWAGREQRRFHVRHALQLLRGTVPRRLHNCIDRTNQIA
jgi:hypothetical protein